MVITVTYEAPCKSKRVFFLINAVVTIKEMMNKVLLLSIRFANKE